MLVLFVAIFVVGYACIALEHPLKVNKTASALLLGVVLWTVYALSYNYFGNGMGIEEFRETFKEGLIEHLGDTAEIVFFLLGAMTIVTLVDEYQGFSIITDRITTNSKKKLLWILSILTFFFSAVLDNMTTAIVMCALLRKLIADQKERWLFAGMVILAANAGGAWSPIGDVTTIMLWIGGQVSTVNIVVATLLPSLVCMLVPVLILSLTLKGDIVRPAIANDSIQIDPKFRKAIFFLGIACLVFVPVFKTITHLPPYLGMLFGVGILWITTEIISRRHSIGEQKLPTAASTLEHIDTPSILFFLGILMAVACLQTCGILSMLAEGLGNAFNVQVGAPVAETAAGIYAIDLIIGVLSSIIDNVPLVAASMGMYDMTTFAPDHPFWSFLAYCAGTGGSLLIIGSAAGVAVMGMEKIDFIWYLKKISWLAFVGYIAGAAVFVAGSLLL